MNSRNNRSRMFDAVPGGKRRKKRTPRPEAPPPDLSADPQRLRDDLIEAKRRYGLGEISEDELYAVADRYLAVVNHKQRELAVKHNMPFRRVKRADLIRSV